MGNTYGTDGFNGTDDVHGMHGMDNMHGADGSHTGGNPISDNMDDILQDDTASANDSADITGDFSVPPPEANDTEPTLVPITALMDERRKRKAAEARFEQLGEPQGGLSNSHDDDGYAPGDGMDDTGYQADVAPLNEAEGTTLNTTEDAARSRYADFDRNLDAFEQLAQHQPQLVAAMRQSPDPGEYAYRIGQEVVNSQFGGQGGFPDQGGLPDQGGFPNQGGLPDPSGYGGTRAATGYGMGQGFGSQPSYGPQPSYGSQASFATGRRHLTPLPESLSGVQSATDHHDTRGWRPMPLEQILGA